MQYTLMDTRAIRGAMPNSSTKTENFTLRVPKEWLAWMRAQADAEGISVASLVMAAVKRDAARRDAEARRLGP